MDDTQIYQHPYPLMSDSPIAKYLLAHMPNSISLFRRMHASSDITLSQAPILLATFSPQVLEEPHHFTIAYVDRSLATKSGVEVWLFSTLEIPTSLPDASSQQKAERALLTLLAAINSFPPAYDVKQRVIPDLPQNIVFLGSIHRNIARIFRARNLARDEIHGPGGPYAKFVWRLDPTQNANTTSNHSTDNVPYGMSWDEVRECDHEGVFANNDIMRTKEMVEILPSIGLRAKTNLGRSDDEILQPLIAWAFLGVDGTVRSLTTRPENRGQGLASLVVRRLLETKLDLLGRDGWASADAALNNAASLAVIRRQGGKQMSECYWMMVDLDSVTNVVNRWQSTG